MGEPASIEVLADQSAGAATKDRSTIGFPYDDLESAEGVVRLVHEHGGRCSIDQLAAGLSYSSVDNGAFRGRMGAARHFGLITVSRGEIHITTLGREIVDPQWVGRARVDAFLSVPLYRRTFDDHRGHMLPPAAGLEAKFVEYGVAPKQKDRARQAFQRSAEYAGFFGQGKDRLVEPPVRMRIQGGETGEQPKPGSGNGGGSGSDDGDQMHPLLRGLMETLPEPGSPWSDTERKQWLTAAESIFNLVYKSANLQLQAARSLPGEQASV